MLDDFGKVGRAERVAPLRNVMLLGGLIRKVQQRKSGTPGMGCFHGFSGFGKSQAALYNRQATGACWVEVKSIWGRKHLTEKICKALAIPAGSTIADNVDRIGEELLKSGRPLLLDEAHILCTRAMMNLVHDIYESSKSDPIGDVPGSAIILIGEEQLPHELAAFERIHNRMLDWVPAQPADLREVGVLADLKFPELTIHEAVLEKALIESKAVARRIVSNLGEIADYARIEGKSEIGAEDIPAIKWQKGEPSAVRRILG